MNYHYCKESTL